MPTITVGSSVASGLVCRVGFAHATLRTGGGGAKTGGQGAAN